jgi:hypothetical protein
MKTTIERQTFDAIVKAFLDQLCLGNRDAGITVTAIHQFAMHDKNRRVFEHQHLASELNGLTRFAAPIQLCVRFEHAEEFCRCSARIRRAAPVDLWCQ